MKQYLYFTCLFLIFTSCKEDNLIERELLFIEINQQIDADEQKALEFQNIFLNKHDDKPDWYKQKIKKEFSDFRNSIDSLLTRFEEIPNKNNPSDYNKSLESFVNDRRLMDTYKDYQLNIPHSDEELQKLYNKRALKKIYLDFVLGYHMGQISFPLSEIYPDEYKQYEFLKNKFEKDQ